MNAGKLLGLVTLIVVGALAFTDCSRKRDVETEDRGRTQPTVVDAPDMGADDRRMAEEAADDGERNHRRRDENGEQPFA